MSFCIFNSNAHRSYVMGLTLVALVPAVGLLLVGTYMQPLDGDLTRIGYYPERDFGWNSTQTEFKSQLYSRSEYVQHYDVVVFGDSFSNSRPLSQWQNYLSASTNWSIVTLDLPNRSLDSLLNNPVYQQSPPKIVIYESVERSFIVRMNSFDPPSSQAVQISTRSIGKNLNSDLNIPSNYLHEVRRGFSLNEIKLDYVRNFLWKGNWQFLPSKAQLRVPKVELDSIAPFSSRINKEMLVLADDFEKISSWGNADLAEIGRRINHMREQIESNGKTKFLLMVAPDKLTTYARFSKDEKIRHLSGLAELAGQHPDVMPRIDLSLIDAVDANTVDVYLPNDSHWGSNGQRIVAETILGFMETVRDNKRE